MYDCNGDGLATLSAFLEREAKKAQNSSLHETGLFSCHGFGLKHKRQDKNEEVYG